MEKTHIDISINKLILLKKLLKEIVVEYQKREKPEMVKKYKGQILLLQIIINEEHAGLNTYIDNLKKRKEKMVKDNETTI